MIKNILQLFQRPNASKESFDESVKVSYFPDLALKGELTAKGDLMRIDEGIAAIISEIQATQTGKCVRCGKELEIPLDFKPGEWIFYERAPGEKEDTLEFQRIDKNKMEIDLSEPVRQEIALHLERNPVCDPPCSEFETDEEKGVKALAVLKDLTEVK